MSLGPVIFVPVSREKGAIASGGFSDGVQAGAQEAVMFSEAASAVTYQHLQMM